MNTKQIDTGGPAFPSPDNTRLATGMSLRDWFAGKAMQGFAANQELVKLVERGFFPGGLPSISEMAYKWADTMIKERNK